jgi:hypothetical protein
MSMLRLGKGCHLSVKELGFPAIDPLQGTFLSQCRFLDLPHFLSSSLPIQLVSECSCAIAISRLEPKKSRQPIYAQSVLLKKTKKIKTNLTLVKYCFPRNVEPQLL